MSSWLILIILCYFGLLRLVGYLTERSLGASYYLAGRQAPWLLVAVGMIGTTISGVTFVSVPGDVLNSGFNYLQLVFGYMVGYAVIAFVLLPLYYKLNLTSIYTYLGGRFGNSSYLTGAGYFIISRLLGSSLRLFLAIKVFDIFLFQPLGFPVEAGVVILVAAIMLYSFKGGIRTIIYTDVLQTLFFLVAMGATIYFIINQLDINMIEIPQTIRSSGYGEFFLTDYNNPRFFLKQILAGAFITIAMTGLDQEMMQKNISIRTLKDAQKNMLTFSTILLFANLCFLTLGALLYIYNDTLALGLTASSGFDTDNMYPLLVFQQFPFALQVIFILGLTAAACGGADAALTSLTTSVCVDFLKFPTDSESEQQYRTRRIVHIGFAIVTILLIIAFIYINEENVITTLFTLAGYTYGPLLGLFTFGLVWKEVVIRDRLSPIVCVAAPVLAYISAVLIERYTSYKFGFEILLLTAIITIAGLWMLRASSDKRGS